MLRGTYSYLSNSKKFVLLITLVLSFLLFSALLGILALVPFYGSDIINIISTPDYTNPSIVNGLKAMQIINMIGGLLLPAVIYLWLCTPNTLEHAGLTRQVAPLALLLSFLLILFAQPFIGWTNELNSYLSLPEWLSGIEKWMKNSEKQGKLITDAFLATTTLSGLLINIFMIAILPAVAEELLFRGALAGLFKNWTKNIHLAVFLSAFIFAAIHMQFYGFLPRFLLGTALGYLFFWSGSLWLPIVAHFTNNLLAVVVEFLFRSGYISTDAENFGVKNAPIIVIISVIVITGIMIYIYNKMYRKVNIGEGKPIDNHEI